VFITATTVKMWLCRVADLLYNTVNSLLVGNAGVDITHVVTLRCFGPWAYDKLSFNCIIGTAYRPIRSNYTELICVFFLFLQQH